MSHLKALYHYPQYHWTDTMIKANTSTYKTLSHGHIEKLELQLLEEAQLLLILPNNVNNGE